MLTIAAALPEFAATVRELDADPYLINVANGTLDLRTGELKPHDPRDRITKVTRAAYDPDAPAPTWIAFLEKVLPDESARAYLQRVAGVALLGKVIEHVLAILTGTGRQREGHLLQGRCAGRWATTPAPLNRTCSCTAKAHTRPVKWTFSVSDSSSSASPNATADWPRPP